MKQKVKTLSVHFVYLSYMYEVHMNWDIKTIGAKIKKVQMKNIYQLIFIPLITYFSFPDVEFALSFIQICLEFDFSSKNVDYILDE